MTRTLTIYCDEASCRRTIAWEPDGVNASPEGWDAIVDDDEVLDACPEHGPFIHTVIERNPEGIESLCPEHGQACPGVGICDWQSGTGKYTPQEA